jgi:hypothetical protein
VSLGLDGFVVLSRVLQVHLNNINIALGRRSTFSTPSFFPLLKKKQEGLMEYVKDTMWKWWHKHTWISLNKKDVTRRCTGWKEYIVHPTYCLTNVQVWNSFSCLVLPQSVVTFRNVGNFMVDDSQEMLPLHSVLFSQ